MKAPEVAKREPAVLPDGTIQIHLAGKGPGFSGRGVRLRMLAGPEKDEASIIAAREIGAEATIPEYERRRAIECTRRTIVAVTKERELKDLDAVQKATWVKVTEEQLCGDGEYSYDRLFAPKDREVIASIFRKRHDVSVDELDDIMGKALTVSEG